MPSPSWVQGRLAPEPAASRALYNIFFKRSSTYMATVMVLATFGGIGYDYAMNYIWESNNKGVRARLRPLLAQRRPALPSARGRLPPPPSRSLRCRPRVPPRHEQKLWKDIKHKYAEE